MTALHLTDKDMTPPFFCQHFFLPTFLLLELVGTPAREQPQHPLRTRDVEVIQRYHVAL
jgi:hypothetical protein